MRKNHHGKKDRLVKRVFALCLALAVICTCLVPVFATEYKDVVDSGEEEIAGFGGDEAAGFGDDFPAVDDGEPREVYDDSETTSSSGSSSGNYTVEEKDDALVYVLNPDPSSSTGTDPVTQWSGEDDVVEKPTDKEVVSGDEIKKLQDMVVYRFWLKELNTLDLQDITAQAQINKMTESEYLARNGEVLWGLYFIQAVPRAETIADYSSYIENPSSNRDPKGELRQFDYWYTLDEFGNRVRLNLTDPTSNILDDKTTTVNVYAAWKDGTVGSDEEEKVDHEDLVDKNPVPVDLTAKAVASYVDEDGDEQRVNLPVEVKNLPSAAHSLSVIHMGDDDMESFYEKHEDDFGSMAPILGLKISPKNAKGEKVQPAKGEKATVTVSGLAALPEMEGATADKLKVLHETTDGSVETLDVLSYQNGTLTFETSSFSPFVVVRTDGYDTELLYDKPEDPITISVGDEETIDGWWFSSNNHSWKSSKDSVVSVVPVTGDKSKATITGKSEGTATITHRYYYNGDISNKPGYYEDEYTVIVKDWKEEAGLYIMFDPEADPDSNVKAKWTGVVTYNNQHAKLGDLTGAVWTKGNYANSQNIFIEGIDGPNSATAKKYIKRWPDDVQYTGPRVLAQSDSFRDTPVTYNGTHSTLEEMIFEMYKGKLVKMYEAEGWTKQEVNNALAGLGAGDITFTITPHKISRYNSGDKPDKHIDCTVTVTCNRTFTVKFHVKKPGKNGYETVNRKLYLWHDGTDNNVTEYVRDNTVPDKITNTEDGSVWVFDGWYRYPQNADGTGSNENAVGWPYTVTQQELNNTNDRVVNFYAHYRKATSNVTITKEVKGLLGDTTNPFTFNVSITKKDGSDCSEGVTAKKGDQPVSDLTNFTLTHGETVTLENVPIGATITVTESTPGEHYTVYSTGYSNGQNGGSDVIFKYVAVANTATASDADEADLMLLSMDEDTAVDTDAVALADATDKPVPNNAITVTNHCTLFPDTGVLLDTLPYIVILAVVAGGVALLMLRKRRKEDD